MRETIGTVLGGEMKALVRKRPGGRESGGVVGGGLVWIKDKLFSGCFTHIISAEACHSAVR